MTREELKKIGIDLSELEDENKQLQKFVKDTFIILFNEKLLSDTEIKKLQNSEYSNENFGIGKLPLLTEIIPEDNDNHYWKEKYFGDKYYLCAQWYNYTKNGKVRAAAQRQKLKLWLLSINNKQDLVFDEIDSQDIYSSLLKINGNEENKQAWTDLYELFKDEKKEYWTRTAYFLAFLFPVYGAYAKIIEWDNEIASLLLSVLGLIVTVFWLVANIKMKMQLKSLFLFFVNKNIGEFYRKIQKSFNSITNLNMILSVFFAIASVFPVIEAIRQIINK